MGKEGYEEREKQKSWERRREGQGVGVGGEGVEIVSKKGEKMTCKRKEGKQNNILNEDREEKGDRNR